MSLLKNVMSQEEKVICPTCTKEGQKSLVFIYSLKGAFGFQGDIMTMMATGSMLHLLLLHGTVQSGTYLAEGKVKSWEF